jgi:hypothetical protein
MYPGTNGSTILCHAPGVKKLVPCPPVVPFYNKWMAGVDQLNHIMKVYGILRKCYYWTTVSYMHGLLDTAMVNNFIMYNRLNPEVGVYLFPNMTLFS